MPAPRRHGTSDSDTRRRSFRSACNGKSRRRRSYSRSGHRGRRDRDSSSPRRDRDRSSPRRRDRDRSSPRRDRRRQSTRRRSRDKRRQSSRRRREHDKKRQKSDSRSESSSSSYDSSRGKKEKKREQQLWSGRPGDGLDSGRYLVEKRLGEGTFAVVVKAEDRQRSDQPVAIKIIRASKRYEEAAEEELRMLDYIQKRGGEENHCIRYLRQFQTPGGAGMKAPHTCIVFPIYGPSIFAFMDRNLKKNGTASYIPNDVQRMSQRILSAINFLHRHKIIHTDLKPENILFKNNSFIELPGRYRVPLDNDIVIIDFGSSLFDNEKKPTTIQTRHYRAPEVVLGLSWSMPADCWSVGCLIVELLFGECVFMTHDNEEHMAMIEKLLRKPPPLHMRQRSRDKGYSIYDRDLNLRWPPPNASNSDLYWVKNLPELSLQCDRARDEFSGKNDCYDLVRALLEYDPDKRMTAREALKQPYVKVRQWDE
eukprot:TRINITY_DN13218_c2_g1_i1.p1 TRINITY_DN13218_c2_g1~~TRINITY_DN13218_c2_g1_i1.p1  ORF type:complete len:501 (+),score=76.82 TRINITY_DN13218_c2_g1_i1:66-1505(+)